MITKTEIEVSFQKFVTILASLNIKFLESIATLRQQETVAACCSRPFPLPRPLASKLTQSEGGFVAKIFGAAKQPPPLHHSTLRVTEYLSLDLLLQPR